MNSTANRRRAAAEPVTSILRNPDVDSYYRATRNPGPTCPPLHESASTDVCVIGGGITGCSTALRLREKGYAVRLLEAGEIGHGASGRSGGQLIFGYACEVDELARTAGKDAAKLWRFACDAMALVERRVQSWGIDCELRRGHVHAAVSAAQGKRLRDWQRVLHRDYGYRTELLGGSELRAQVDSPRYHSALHDPRSGHLHPLNYTLGVAQAAAAAGAVLHAQSPALAIRHDGGLRVSTATGELRCRAVAVCTNAYGGGRFAPVERNIVAVGSYIAATAPLPAAAAAALLPGGAAVADLCHILDYYRLSADRRLLFGSRVGVLEPGEARLRKAMAKRILRVFPQLGRIDIDYAWGGHIAVTRNWLPNFGRAPGEVWFANGFSAQGMTLSSLAGEVLADAIAGSSQRFDVFAGLRHRPIPGPRGLHRALVTAALLHHRLLDLWG